MTSECKCKSEIEDKRLGEKRRVFCFIDGALGKATNDTNASHVRCCLCGREYPVNDEEDDAPSC